MRRSIFAIFLFAIVLRLAEQCAGQICAFTIGGAVYSNCSDPIGSGVSGIRVCVLCVSGFASCGESGLGLGIWFIPGVPCGECTVCAEEDATHGWQHVTGRCKADCDPCTTIEVDQTHQAGNQSIQFVSTDRADLNCDDDVDLMDHGILIDCQGGPNATVAPQECTAADWARSDLDSDGDVDLKDYARFQLAFRGP